MLQRKMFRIIGFFFCLLPVMHLPAQEFTYPKLPVSVKQLAGLLPANWFLKDSAYGDLNRDGLDDYAIVMEYRDTLMEKRPNGYTNEGGPRILAILVKNKKNDSLDLLLQNNTFITRYGEGGMDPEAYGKVSIKKGVLQVLIQFLRGSLSYDFKILGGDVYLVAGRAGGSSGGIFEFFEADFINRKISMESGKISAQKLKKVQHKLPLNPLKKLRDMTMIYEWEFYPDYYL